MKRVLGVILALGLAPMGADARADSVELTMSREYGPQTMMGQRAHAFVEKVASLSEGELVIHFGEGPLTRLRSVNHLEAINADIIQLADSHSGALATSMPLFSISSLPTLVDNPRQARELYRLARPSYEALLARHDQILLYALPWPPSGLWSRKPIAERQDLQGLTVRAYDRNTQRVLLNLGAIASVLGWEPMQQQLAEGRIEAVMTSALGGLTAELNRTLDHYTALQYAMPLNIVHMSQARFEALDAPQREALLTAAAEIEDTSWDAIAGILKETHAQLEHAGVTVRNPLTPDLKQSLSRASISVIESWRSKVGPKENELLDHYLDVRSTL
jgi:TRAP-type C4-dicarboxylate transport system substrate-binding protein